MEFRATICNPETQHSGCVIIGIFEQCRLSLTANQYDKISNGYISTLIQRGEISGFIGQTLLLYNVPNVLPERILLVGCGKEQEFSERQYKQIIKTAISKLINTGTTDAVCFLNEINIKGRNTYWKIRFAVETIKNTVYKFNQLKSNNTEHYRVTRKISFHVSTNNELVSGAHAIKHGSAIANGIKATKDLGNLPPNICNTSYLSSKAHQLAENYSELVTTHTIDEQQMKELGMNAYLAVGQGSMNESLMSIIEYKGNTNSKSKPIVLIGKGMIFDAGGISIKPADKLDEMKYDMCGAAAVYGVMLVVSELNLPLNIIGVLASCENIIDSGAFRPGDVLTTLSGQTVEVLNTDAEGRLVLCDSLTYVERFNPDVVIDIATLTGACVIALGNHLTGLMSNDDQLADEIVKAANQAEDRVWRLPLGDDFQKQLKSNIADMTNVGGRSGGAITAGCFLSRFASQYKWAHLDIAGTAWLSGKNKGATGRPVSMISQFLLNRAGFANE